MKKGCRLGTFKCERDGSLLMVNDRARDMQKGHKMRPCSPFGDRDSRIRPSEAKVSEATRSATLFRASTIDT